MKMVGVLYQNFAASLVVSLMHIRTSQLNLHVRLDAYPPHRESVLTRMFANMSSADRQLDGGHEHYRKIV